ncbi:hypothetical protein HOLleu_35322 [Holothuria leucospilota]|uniref:Uncharacterized protein n=1 Tax=Holothuria leucospilota TaxID=206669 RepID=A0A9Q1BGT6_HOLLE|nr:hypothetical protein HOLleu_35322 [Holothuria leucospilota]
MQLNQDDEPENKMSGFFLSHQLHKKRNPFYIPPSEKGDSFNSAGRCNTGEEDDLQEEAKSRCLGFS